MKTTALAILMVALFTLAACSSDADVASQNLSKAADNFHVLRRVVLYNSITDKYVVEVDGFCSIGNNDPNDRVTVTCKVADGNDAGSFVKDIFVKSDNTLVFAEQLHGQHVSTHFYKVIFKPSTVVPNIEVR